MKIFNLMFLQLAVPGFVFAGSMANSSSTDNNKTINAEVGEGQVINIRLEIGGGGGGGNDRAAMSNEKRQNQSSSTTTTSTSTITTSTTTSTSSDSARPTPAERNERTNVNRERNERARGEQGIRKPTRNREIVIDARNQDKTGTRRRQQDQ